MKRLLVAVILFVAAVGFTVAEAPIPTIKDAVGSWTMVQFIDVKGGLPIFTETTGWKLKIAADGSGTLVVGLDVQKFKARLYTYNGPMRRTTILLDGAVLFRESNFQFNRTGPKTIMLSDRFGRSYVFDLD